MPKDKLTYGVMYGSLVLPIIWIFLKLWESDSILNIIWLPILSLIWGMFWINEKFIAKEDIPKSEESLGPQEQFRSDWDRRRDDQGVMKPVKTFSTNNNTRKPPERF